MDLDRENLGKASLGRGKLGIESLGRDSLGSQRRAVRGADSVLGVSAVDRGLCCTVRRCSLMEELSVLLFLPLVTLRNSSASSLCLPRRSQPPKRDLEDDWVGEGSLSLVLWVWELVGFGATERELLKKLPSPRRGLVSAECFDVTAAVGAGPGTGRSWRGASWRPD